jgi:hypothetical protein
VLKNIKIFLLISLLSTSSYAGVIRLADQHQIVYDETQWEYVLSEDTFKKSLGLLESKSNENIKGMIDTEIRFKSTKNTPSAIDVLQEECQKLKTYWGAKEFDVKIDKNRYCLIEQKTAEEGLLVTQVIEAKSSRATPHMFFLHTWTFHTQKENLVELRSLLKDLREMQP